MKQKSAQSTVSSTPLAFPRTLDEAALLLIQLEAHDEAGIRSAHAAFLAGASAADSDGAPTLAAAANHLGGAIGETHDKVAEALRSAAQVIEAGMAARDRVNPRKADGEAGGQQVESSFDELTSGAAGDAANILPIDTDVDLLSGFIAESRDYLEGAEAALVALENDPRDQENINTVFRAFHTIKGTSAFLGLTHVTTFGHEAESLLSKVRDRTIPFTRACADLALRSSDMLRTLLNVVESASPGDTLVCPSGYDALIHALSAIDADGDGSIEHVPVAETSPGSQTAVVASQDEGVAQSGRVEASVRIRTERLDRLIDMVGELVIAQAMINQDDVILRGGYQDLARKVGHCGKIVRELQDLSMSMRMVPLKAVFRKMIRLSRDAAHRSGKRVELTLEGEDTEIDRNMVDVIGDPLVHMVRNAVDHGIETPAEREAVGKSGVGRLRLAAYHAGGNVVVELQDDGKGLDRERIIRKAIANGLIESEKGMSDSDVFELIFAPGFSTKDVVTDLSGRGVGMDVVKRNIESLQGRIEIKSEPGRGSLFTVRLPLTLAITDGMLVQVGADRYIIPTTRIELSFRPEAHAISTIAGRGEVVLLRDTLMPVIRLHRLFGIENAIHDPTSALLVVTSVGDQRYALLVDGLLGQQQVVAKPLGDGVGRVRGISGGAILGDGRVGLILDVAELVQVAQQHQSGERGRATLPLNEEALVN